ncbi:putative 50S ribosomal subunit protein L29 [Candidatus Tremblaya princeps]|uniref:Putative 50S ribosomal subunit protein L29 n=1 Tax=Tremblaya princeps TaxID=189385 RepID=A0A143WPG5_TREPR|nr:putative 50S ribosomal subunit protein L29 [Candidatus Tremblaya princeps]
MCARFMAAELAALMMRHAAAEARMARCGTLGAVFPRAGAMAARSAHALIHLECLGCGST